MEANAPAAYDPLLRLLVCLCAALALVGPAAAAAADGARNHRALVVDGRPFFPILAWSQCPEQVEAALAIGVNVFMGPCETAREEELLERVGQRAYVVAPIARRGTLAHPRLLGWTQVDEPENHGIRPRDLALPARGARRPTFLSLTSRFLRKAEGPARYRAYVERADVVGFNLYPIATHCRSAWIRLGDVYEGQRELARLAFGKPTFQWLETGPLEGFCGSVPPVTPRELRAQAWLAVAGGATGIGWFTHTWTTGSWLRFDLTAPVTAAAARTSARSSALAPVLLAPQRRARAGRPVYAGAREHGGRVYVIAVNASSLPVTRRVRSRALGGVASVTPLGGGRTIAVEDGSFADEFEALAVRIYVGR